MSLFKQTDQRVVFEIIDNGVGMSETDLKKIGRKSANKSSNHFSGVGVENINRRLKLIYGEECGVKISSTIGLGTTIKIKKQLSNNPKEQLVR